MENTESGVVNDQPEAQGPKFYREYLLLLHDESGQQFINDCRVRAAAVRSKCDVELTRRICNKRIHEMYWARYNILRISSSNPDNITKCNRILERYFPMYVYRKEYGGPDAVLLTQEYCADNTDLYYGFQRVGAMVPFSDEQPERVPLYVRSRSDGRNFPTGRNVIRSLVRRNTGSGMFMLASPCNAQALRVITHVYPERRGCVKSGQRPQSSNQNCLVDWLEHCEPS